jgi:hypothetical protein
MSDPTNFDHHHALASLRRRRAGHIDAARRLTTLALPDPRGGLTSLEGIEARLAELRGRIDAEERTGSRRHDRISRTQRVIKSVLPLLDGVILLWFLAGVLNVDVHHPDFLVLSAIALAVLCTVAVAAWTDAVGRHLQRFTDTAGSLVVPLLDGVSTAMLLATGLMAALLGTLMFIRVHDEVYQATGVAGTAAIVVAAVLAAAIVLVNLYVLQLSIADGSPQTRELEQLARAARPHTRRRARHIAHADALSGRIAVRIVAARTLDLPPTLPPSAD